MKLRTATLAALAVLFLAAGPALAGGDYREEFSKTVSLKAGGSFSLDNVNGEVRVTSAAGDKVEIKAVKTARHDEKDLKDVEIRVEETADGVSVKAIWPRDRHDFDVSVRFDVTVPDGTVLRGVETVNGGVEATGTFGSADLETTNGKVVLSGVRGDVRATTTNGSIEVRDVRGKVEAETTNGGIELERVTFAQGLRAETVNGSISLALGGAEPLDADLRAETVHGHVTVDFPVTLDRLGRSRTEVSARIGKGGPEIRLATVNGSIRITK